MKPLPEHLCRNGCYYDLVQRMADVAVYSLRYENGGPILGFDVFRVRRMGERVFKGKIIPPYEQWPPGEAYGRYAWSYDTEKTAMEKFIELTAKKIKAAATQNMESVV
jgi:hypothetical protein